MDAITLGNPNLFLKGIAEQTIFDPSTGNIVGYDNIASESAITSSVNLQEITGFGNTLVGVIPDTTRLTGTYTSQAFNLNIRKLISGGKLSYNAIVPVCETVTADSEGKITIAGNPEKHYAQSYADDYAWGYASWRLREGGPHQLYDTHSGENIQIDLTDKTAYVPYPNVAYDVMYFTKAASAQVLELPENFTPSVVTIQQKYGVYRQQNSAVSNSTFAGWLYVIVPRAILNGNVGLDGNQTSNSTTDGSWMAISKDNAAIPCPNCNGNGERIAYYVFSPCAEATDSVEALVVVGGAVTVSATAGSSIHTAQIPLRFLMPDGSTVQPYYTGLEFESSATGKATVSDEGIVTGVAEGEAEITITLTRTGKPTLTTYCNVTVTA